MSRLLRLFALLAAIALGAVGVLRFDRSTATSAPGAASAPARLDGVRCSRVHDGDTLSVVRDGRTLRVRIFGIDAPERTQPYSNRSRQRAKELAEDRRVDLDVVETDAYGRLVARVEVDGEDLGARLIEEGLAWHYRRYSDDPRYARLEAGARAARRGLWSDRTPTPPWVFRRERR